MISDSKMKIGFHYTAVLRNPDGSLAGCTAAHNLFPLEGRNHMLASAIGGGQQIAAWYIGIYRANYQPVDGDTMAAFPAAAVEITQYAETTRRLLVANQPQGGVLDSVGHEVVFTLSADTTIYGGFISSGQSKGSTNGILLSAVKFAQPQQGYQGQTVTIGAVATLINV